MSCLSELTYAMYADQELGADERQQVETHLAACSRCRQLVDALQEENRVLAAVLVEAESPAAATAVGRPWHGPAAWTGLGVAVAAALLHAARGGAARGVEVDWWGVTFEVVFFLGVNAGWLGRLVAGLALVTMAAMTLGGAVLLVRRPAMRVAGLLTLAAGLIFAAPAMALDTRTGTTVTIPATETVPGTLVVLGDTVVVEGTVEGDLITAARTVELRGTVTGDLVLAGRDAHVGGTVHGNVYALIGTLRVEGYVTRSLYGLNRATVVEPGAHVGADANVTGRSLDLQGSVGRSVWAFVASARVAGPIGHDLAVTADRVEVLPRARIRGSVTARVRAADDVRIDPGATIEGPRHIQIAPPSAAVWGEPAVYFWLGTSLFGALLLGVVALLLVPGFFHASVAGVAAWWWSLGLGVLVLLGAPIAVGLAAVTLVGLPLALIALALYLVGLYGAKIVVGTFIGRALLRSTRTTTRDSVLALVIGLLVLTGAIELPFVGPWIQLIVLCLGLGAFSRQLYRLARRRAA